MKKLTIDINTKWMMEYRAYKNAKTAKSKSNARNRLFSLLQENALMNQYNHENQ